jgi:flagellar basal body rod protein FlgG
MMKHVFLWMMVIAQWGLGAEQNPMSFEEYDDIVNPVMKLNATSMGGFMDAMKSYIVYTAIQHLPGAKESGVGYYYDNQTRGMKRVLFYRLSEGYPRETNKPLDFYIEGKGFFVIELPGGWPAYTQDGRFERDEMGRLVTFEEHFPVLGENGPIYVANSGINVSKDGVIYQNDQVVDVFRVEWPRRKHDLKSFNHKIFYFSKEDWENPDKIMPADVKILQGYVADSSITKGYIGLVPEWKNGHEANVKVVKAYLKNMSLAVQAANPQ